MSAAPSLPARPTSSEHDRRHAGAWNDPTKGGEIAKTQMDQGVDVIYAAAGGTASAFCRPRLTLASSASASTQPEQPAARQDLTSMLKRVDVAVYSAFMDGKNGTFAAGTNDLGLKEGVDYAMDDNNKDPSPRTSRRLPKGQGRHHCRHHHGARLHVG